MMVGSMSYDQAVAVIEGIEPNEEIEQMPDKEEPSEEAFTEDEHWDAKQEEIEKLTSFQGFHDVPASQATTAILKPTWVKQVKNGKLCYRLCVRPFGRGVKWTRDELFCPTPSASVGKILLVRAALKGHAVRFFDISRAFLHTPVKRRIFLQPPVE